MRPSRSPPSLVCRYRVRAVTDLSVMKVGWPRAGYTTSDVVGLHAQVMQADGPRQPVGLASLVDRGPQAADIVPMAEDGANVQIRQRLAGKAGTLAP